ncbi:MAG: hypothetical protein H0V76_08525 [Blastocatellia bacterium]|nr:hypothetical protein [Blastocatellia bacterium]
MPRKLTISLDGNEMQVSLIRIDREKLYGSVEVEAFDEKGKPAEIKLLAADGRTLINKGGTGLEVLTESGNSIDRSELKAVDENGEILEEVPSSFDGPNEIGPATIDEYLSLIVKSVYLLDPVEADALDLLYDHLSDSRVFKFPFSYRGGTSYDSAFIVGADNAAFMVVGREAELQFLKLNQAATYDSTGDGVTEDDISFELL